MKRTYASPKLTVESFRLTQHLTSCSGIKIGSTGIACVLSDPDSTDFMKMYAIEQGMFMDTSACMMLPAGMDGTDGVCYDTSINMAFTS